MTKRRHASSRSAWVAHLFADGGLEQVSQLRPPRLNPWVTWRVLALVVCVFAYPTPADELDLGSTKLERIRIIDLEGSEIAYRTPSGAFGYAPIAQVTRIYVDTVGTLTNLNEAEARLSENDYVRAINHYERALRMASSFWKRLVRARLIQACDRADLIDPLVHQFIILIRDEETGPALAAELLPRLAPSPQSRGIPRANRAIAEVIHGMRSQSARVLLETVKFHIASRTNAAETAGLARELVRQPIPPLIATRAVYRVTRQALEVLLDRGDTEAVLGRVNDDLKAAPEKALPELLLVKARALLAAANDDESVIRAGWAAMRIVIHYADDELAPQALLLASLIHERMGLAPTAARLLDECLNHGRLTAAVRDEANARLQRLRSTG